MDWKKGGYITGTLHDPQPLTRRPLPVLVHPHRGFYDGNIPGGRLLFAAADATQLSEARYSRRPTDRPKDWPRDSHARTWQPLSRTNERTTIHPATTAATAASASAPAELEISNLSDNNKASHARTRSSLSPAVVHEDREHWRRKVQYAT